MQITRRQAECFYRLKNDPELAPFREYLAAREAEEGRNCRRFEGVNLHRAQGQSMAYEELSKRLEDAISDLEKMKDQK